MQTKRSQLASPFMVIVEGLGAAGIALGDSSKEITEKYGEPVIGSSEDPVYLTYYNSGMEFSLKGDKVIAIFLYAAQSNRSGTYYKYPGTTKKGIGPKSREEDVVKKYGKPDKIAGETYYYSRLGIAFDFDKIKRVELIRIFPPEGV